LEKAIAKATNTKGKDAKSKLDEALVWLIETSEGEPSSSVTNEPNPDDRALYIQFKGREWIVLYSKNNFLATPADHRRVKEQEVRNLFQYLTNEGFIDGGEPATTT